jgi:carbonic anhydrase
MSLMNISPQNIAGTCESKCSYAFNYPTTNSTTVSNYGSHLQFTYELSNNSPVLYNNNSYNVSSINIYSPSLHKYNGSSVDGEVVIRHTPVSGGNSLYVIIPLSTGGLTTNGSQVISNVVNAASKSAPSAGKNTNKGVGEFTLNNFIPMKQFYSYTTSKMDCIVFDISNAVGINADDLSTFKKIVTAAPSNSFVTESNSPTPLFINTKGPSNSITGGGSDIYIDCQPTDQVVGSVTKDKKSVNDSVSQENLMYFVYVVVFMFLIFILYSIMKYITNLGGDSETTPMKGGFFKKYK